MDERFDLVVIGAGPAGYVASLRAAQLGMKVACIDRRTATTSGEVTMLPGGTCLHEGCIPSKALLETSGLFSGLAERLGSHGIRVAPPTLDLGAVHARKDKLVSGLAQGIQGLLHARGVTQIAGEARLSRGRRVMVTRGAAVHSLDAGSVILAAGSQAAPLRHAAFAPPFIVDSTAALAFSEAPKRLGIIGAGIIGLELGSVWRRFGSEVVLFEAQKEFLTMADEQVAREAARRFRAQGLDIRLGARVLEAAVDDGAVRLAWDDGSGARTERFDRLIVAVGRQPASSTIAAGEAELLLDEWGFVHVDPHCATNVPGIYAIGDLVRGPMLAHKGSEEGILVAERIAGQSVRMDYDAIPSVIYTDPEMAWVGPTEQLLRQRNVSYRTGVFPFGANGRARASGDTDGFVKVLADETSGQILGVHMIGAGVSELIGLGGLALGFGASAEDLALSVFAHPTRSEALREAALAAMGRGMHSLR